MPVVITPSINHGSQSDAGCRTPAAAAASVHGDVFDLASLAGRPRVRVCSRRCRIGSARPARRRRRRRLFNVAGGVGVG